MKKMKLALIGTVLFAGLFSASGQTPIRMDVEAISLLTLGDTTIYITKSDQITNLSIYVPAGASDSTTVYGKYKVIGGFASNGITIAPGEVALNLGFGYNFLDSITIVSGSQTIVTALPKLIE